MGEATTPRDLIVEVIGAYCQLCDDGRFDEWGERFAEDAEFVVMGATHRGRAAIQAFITAAQGLDRRGKHLVSVPRVTIGANGATAAAWTDYVFVDQSSSITSAGRYHDEFGLGSDGQWRFSRREIVFRGDAPTATQPPPG